VIFSLVILMILSQNSVIFAQTDESTLSEQNTLTGGLLNDPVAQDILRKIELTKKWIADLEKREYEKLQAQEFLEEKRAIALERLNQDLKEWENLWSNYSSRSSFERFVDTIPSEVQGVFWDSFEFKEMKVKAGKDALIEVMKNGGTLKEAREAYLKAAETKRIELVEQNNQFNVKHHLAYYQEQVLFDTGGKFIRTSEAREKLKAMFSDYRENAGYLEANPDENISQYSSLKTNPDTQCREGFTVVYRVQVEDYACLSESIANKWEKYGIVVFPGDENKIQDNNKVLEIENKINVINNQIRGLSYDYENKQVDLKKKYDKKYNLIDVMAEITQREINKNYYRFENMTSADLVQQTLALRNEIGPAKDKILEEKLQVLDDLKKEFDEKLRDIVIEYKNSLEIKVIWNSDMSRYQAVKK